MQTDGYMIVLKPLYLLEQYYHLLEQRYQMNAPGIDDYLRQLRVALPEIDAIKYRGISRNRLMAFPCLDEKVIEEFETSGCEMRNNAEARYRFRQLIGDVSDNYNADVDEDLLASQSDAMQVFDLLDDSERWEIIHLSRKGIDSQPTTLGFDVGYWGGDHFSLIADTVVTPLWHPPAPDDFGGLKQALSTLNASLLFDSPEAAMEYRAYYESRPWAETESREGQFCVVRVDAIKSVEHGEKGVP